MIDNKQVLNFTCFSWTSGQLLLSGMRLDIPGNNGSIETRKEGSATTTTYQKVDGLYQFRSEGQEWQAMQGIETLVMAACRKPTFEHVQDRPVLSFGVDEVSSSKPVAYFQLPPSDGFSSMTDYEYIRYVIRCLSYDNTIDTVGITHHRSTFWDSLACIAHVKYARLKMMWARPEKYSYIERA